MSNKRFSSIRVSTCSKDQFIDITGEVSAVIAASGVCEGMCFVYVPHTTAGVTINENADPDVTRDMIKGLRGIVPEDPGYEHAEGNSPAHIKSTIVGTCISVPVVAGRMTLGTWQGIYFCEFDGPRDRKVNIKLQEG